MKLFQNKVSHISRPNLFIDSKFFLGQLLFLSIKYSGFEFLTFILI